MLMDFGYRYSSGVLSDARDLTSESGQNMSSGRGGSSAASAQDGDVSMEALRIAIASKSQFQVQPRLPKEDLLELANEINRRPLPVPQREFGLRLPAEKYCALGTGWGTKPQWGLDEEFEVEKIGEAEERAVEDSAMKDVTGEGAAEDEEVDQEEFEGVMGGGADTSMKDA
jgi:transcription initiation factor TFIID subunit 9B